MVAPVLVGLATTGSCQARTAKERTAPRALGAVTLEEIERLHAEGHFPPGSMGPKIEAVIRFLRAGGRRALITNPESLPQAIEGRAGTHFVGGI